ncbi:TPA: ead/Ea22-like family protein [Enterobacter kobei]|nr:ead/Ea22-like family protein [Enterobacter kobei]HDC4610009.1 ead/Ea22-like family protein [Enterobacter kobei]HDC4623270.1 ead/Ea22-like family protein [Enterobacter kobei]HDR2359641.1 ead/Ea22-like family protein [Enterobacter kobei]
MSNTDKRANQVSRYDLVSGYMQKWPDGEFVYHSDYLALLDELEAKDKRISFLKNQLAQLANFNPDWDKLEAETDSLREHMAELTAARKRIAELSHHLQNAHEFIEHTEAFGYEASNGILCCGDAQWNIDASKSALAAAGKGE